MSFVLDASIALAWCFPDESTAVAQSILLALRETEGVVPGIWAFEVANGLLSGERRGRLVESDVVRAVELLEALPLRPETHALSAALGSLRMLAHRQNLSAYDASYLDLALRYGLPLATLDAHLREAAERAGVALMQ
jgi:predicted nucleic acid-binding protein